LLQACCKLESKLESRFPDSDMIAGRIFAIGFRGENIFRKKRRK